MNINKILYFSRWRGQIKYWIKFCISQSEGDRLNWMSCYAVIFKTWCCLWVKVYYVLNDCNFSKWKLIGQMDEWMCWYSHRDRSLFTGRGAGDFEGGTYKLASCRCGATYFWCENFFLIPRNPFFNAFRAKIRLQNFLGAAIYFWRSWKKSPPAHK